MKSASSDIGIHATISEKDDSTILSKDATTTTTKVALTTTYVVPVGE
jgi:hypothetical protein